MTIIYWTVGWLFGIWISPKLEVPVFFWLIPLGGVVIAAFFFNLPAIFRTVLLILAAICLGSLRAGTAITPIGNDHIASYNGAENIQLTGFVVEEPEIRDTSSSLVVQVQSITGADGQEKPVSGQVQIRTGRYPIIKYGTRVQLAGSLATPSNRNGFDYRGYLARQGIRSVMDFPAVTILETGAGNPFYQTILTPKYLAQERINQLLPGSQAALLSGILLGNDDSLPEELDADFRETGTTHIIAISGFNIAIIAGILLRGSRHLVPYRTAAWIALAGIAVYTIFVGSDAAVVRAAVMGGLFIIAMQILGRPTFVPAALFTAAFAMTLVNPQILWDIGFQLSFAATIGLVLYVGPWSQGMEAKLQPQLSPNLAHRATRLTSDVLLTTLAATMMTLPVILYHFGTLSLISPLVNLLILPAQPGVMLWGGLAAFLGMALPVLGQIPAWIAWLFLTYTISIVRFLAGLPLTTVPISFSLGSAAAVYAIILGLTWLFNQDREKRKQLLGSTGWARLKRAGLVAIIIGAIFTVIWVSKRPDGKLHVLFFDVGQGDATFIQTPNGRQVLVDGGQYGSRLLDEMGREMPFWDKDIDLVVATHPDDDHFLGLIDVMDRYQVGTLITNGEPADSANYEALLAGAEKIQTPVHQALAGEVLDLDSGVRMEILHPGPALDPGQDNDNSVAIRLDYENFSLLLTGDAEAKAEQAMLAAGRPLQALIYKAGHHGAKTSNSKLFLAAVQPQIVVISAGEGNNYGHPHDEVLNRAQDIGATVLRTDKMGTIEIISDGRSYWWKLDQ